MLRARIVAALRIGAFLACAIPAVPGRAADLVAHNGFEACWSTAITESQFLQLIGTSIDGQTACLPASSDSCGPSCTYTICDSLACPGGVKGCPLTLHPDSINNNDFAGGFFYGPMSADDVVVPVNFNVLGFGGSCTPTLSGADFDFSLSYMMLPDGNSGLYAASLEAAAAQLSSVSNITGTATCAGLEATFIADVEAKMNDGAESLINARAQAATVGESICPLTP